MKNVLLLLPMLALAGCSNSSEPTAQEGSTAQNNFSRPLTQDEQAKMGNRAKGAPADAPKKGP